MLPIIPVLARPHQEDKEFEANLSFIARSCLKKPETKQNKKSVTVVWMKCPRKYKDRIKKKPLVLYLKMFYYLITLLRELYLQEKTKTKQKESN